MAPALAESTTPLEIQLGLLAPDSTALKETPVRLVLANAPGWQNPESGVRLRTDEKGIARWSTRGLIDRRHRKLPSNFFTQLAAPTQETFHFSVAAQLSYLGKEWLLVTELDCFADGTSAQLDGVRLYGQDSAGAFTVPVNQDARGWHFPGLALPATTPGFQVARLGAVPSGSGWSVEWVLRRLPEPIVR